MTDTPVRKRSGVAAAVGATASSSASQPFPAKRGKRSGATTPKGAAKASVAKDKNSKSTPAPDSKASKGLRHFSMKVCRKVEEKGHTTYNEVADELVREVMAERNLLPEGDAPPRGKYDEKNIRRRVYDALNVLMAMDIISKEKKEIRWKGLPSNAHHDLDMLQREGQFRRSEVERKREALRELLIQQVCFRNLVQHNANSERLEASSNTGSNAPGTGTSASTINVTNDADGSSTTDEKIPLPFIVVNTHSSAVIQCEMSPDRTDVMFDFSMPFEINDDNTILKRLGM